MIVAIPKREQIDAVMKVMTTRSLFSHPSLSHLGTILIIHPSHMHIPHPYHINIVSYHKHSAMLFNVYCIFGCHRTTCSYLSIITYTTLREHHSISIMHHHNERSIFPLLIINLAPQRSGSGIVEPPALVFICGSKAGLLLDGNRSEEIG